MLAKLIHSMLVLILSFVSFSSFAAGDAVFSVQIVSSTLAFEKADIAKASMVKVSDEDYGVQIQLTKKAALKFEKLTAANVGKLLNIVHKREILSKVKIQSALSGEFLVTGLSESDAKRAVENVSS